MSRVQNFIYKEWLFILALLLFVITSLLVGKYPSYSMDEYEVLFILWMFFIVIEGLKKSLFLDFIANRLANMGSSFFPLLFATFLISLFITNDVALIIMVPITLMIPIEKRDLLIILEAIISNSASLLPNSTPQNLYI